MTTPSDPRKVLEALLSGAATLPFPVEVLSRARALASAPEKATAQELEALPDSLAHAVLEAAMKAKVLALAESLAESNNKGLAKAGKKALYRLRSLGVAVPERREAAPSGTTPSLTTSVAALGAEEALPSVASALTGTGERALIVGRPVRGRMETLQVVYSDESGVLHLHQTELSRGQYRKMLRDGRKPDAPSSIEIPLEEARRLLGQAVGANLRSRTPFPDGLESVLRRLSITADESLPDVPPPEELDQAHAVNGAALHDEPEIAQWLPHVDAIRSLAQKAQEIATSALYIDEKQRAEQLRRTLQQTAEAHFDERVRQLYGRRLWIMGDFFEKTGRPLPAQTARAEARRLFHGAPGLFSPFALRLFEKVLALSAAAGFDEREGGPALGDPAAQSGEDEASSEKEGPTGGPEKRSPGGLILP